MAELSAHAVRPTCPRCERPVRSGVELATALSELIAALPSLSRDAQDEQFRRLDAELAGVHLVCRPTRPPLH